MHTGYCKSGQEPMVRELTGPTDDAAIIIFLNRQNIKLPSFSIDSATLKDYQKNSFCAVDNDQLTTGQRTDNQCLRNAQSQGRYLYHTPADQGSGFTKEEGQKDSKSQRLGRAKRKQCPLDVKDGCNHELTADGVACTRPAKIKSVHTPA